MRTNGIHELSTPDNLLAFIAGVDELITTFKDVASRGAMLTVEQIVEELLPKEFFDHKTLVDHCYALAVPLAILLQRAVMR
jgi:hypothetical protein